MGRSIVEVAVNVPLSKLFHYSVPEALAESLEVGHRVLIPFGPRTGTGICVGFLDRSEIPELKPISAVLHPDCRFDAHLLELTRWIAEYYRAGWGEILEAALPPPVRSAKEKRPQRWISASRPAPELTAEAKRAPARAKGMARVLLLLAENPGPHRRPDLLRHARIDGRMLGRLVAGGWAVEELGPDRPPDPVAGSPDGTEGLEALSSRGGTSLSHDQQSALETVTRAVETGAFRPILIHGVTGSGKTEVYLRALRDVLARGKRGLILVPEISLTPQMVLRFRQGLPGETIAVLHSMLTEAERTRYWREIQHGKANVVIGARSAVFAPVGNLGLIVVDEEHDSSYKQESSPRYNARDVAVVRARMLGIPIVMGSATPSLESIHNARTGKYTLVEMPRRVTAHDLPVVSIVTLGGEFYRLDGSGLITKELDAQIRQRLRDREQTLLFLNRRGFATYVHCIRCGFVMKCPDCDITLTFHRSQDSARCHYCGHGADVPASCPDCEMSGLRRSGVGTEKITSEMARRYPEARVARLDRDTATSHRALQGTLARFAHGEYDILVGTQMVAKGHDFPNLTLVGIIHADTGLHFPDFRAAERTFQLITQVAGRAGRGEKSGRVIIQTFCPDHFAIRCAAQGEYDEFCRRELEFRKMLGYPPYGRVVKILFQGRNESDVAEEAAKAAAILKGSRACRILGPVPAPIARIQGRHRQQILLKSSVPAGLREALRQLEEGAPPRKGVVDRIVDVDPLSML